MSIRSRLDGSGGREPREHCLNLEGDQKASSRITNEKCEEKQLSDIATSPISFGQSKLVDIMDVNSKTTRDILEKAEDKLKEACSVLKADYDTVVCLMERIKANDKRATNMEFDCETIKLNVGGHLFDTSIETLKKYRPNLFTQLLSGEGNFKKSADGYYFFDRDGVHFRHILNYMRHGSLPDYIIRQCKDELLFEATFYGIKSLVDFLNDGNAASARSEMEMGGDDNASYSLPCLNSSAVIDEAVDLVKKAYLSLDGDITRLDIREHRKCKAALCMPNEVVKLNVGGVFFQTNLSTLMKDEDSLLVSLVTGNLDSHQSNDGFFYIDRDGTRFKHILNFLRDGKIPEKVFSELGEELMIEADFFELRSLKRALDLLMHKTENRRAENSSVDENVVLQLKEMLEGVVKQYGKNQGNEDERNEDTFDSRRESFLSKQEENFQHMTDKLDSLRSDMFSKIMKQSNEILDSMDENTSELTGKVKKVVVESLESAFKVHEDKMELELKAHNSPNLCAFSKSTILNNNSEYKVHLHQFLVKTGNTGNFKLIYSVEKNGLDTFHEFCDDKPPTLILVKDTTGSIFGGFTTCYWNKYYSELYTFMLSILKFPFDLANCVVSFCF